MDAVEYLKNFGRLCKSFDSCLECVLGKELCSKNYNFSEEKVEVVEKFAKEHQKKTRQSEFIKMFPNVRTFNGIITISPCTIDTSMDGKKCIDSCDECAREYWTEELKNE